MERDAGGRPSQFSAPILRRTLLILLTLAWAVPVGCSLPLAPSRPIPPVFVTRSGDSFTVRNRCGVEMRSVLVVAPPGDPAGTNVIWKATAKPNRARFQVDLFVGSDSAYDVVSRGATPPSSVFQVWTPWRPGGEIGVEIDPRTMTDETVAAYDGLHPTEEYMNIPGGEFAC